MNKEELTAELYDELKNAPRLRQKPGARYSRGFSCDKYGIWDFGDMSYEEFDPDVGDR